MRTTILALFATGLVVAQTNTNSVNDAYQRGVQLGNQQAAILVECLSHPSCAAAMREAQAQKAQAKADKERAKAEAQARKEQAKADKERQKTEIKLARLRLKLERESAKDREAAVPAASSTP
jgi:ribosomal protein L12E/L44/L45/RPP1/RPP2